MLAWVFLGGPLDPHLPRQGVQVQSLVGELRCHVPGGQINFKKMLAEQCVFLASWDLSLSRDNVKSSAQSPPPAEAQFPASQGWQVEGQPY